MNKIAKLVLVALVLMLAIPNSMAVNDASTPYTVTLNYIVPSDTTFTVTLAGSETTVDFNPTGKNSTDVEPDSQNASTSTPIATISNTGNVVQDFSVNLTAAQESWANVTVSNSSDYANPIYLSDVAQNPTGWIDVAISADVVAYMYANFTEAVAGTAVKTLQINTVDST